MSLHDADQWEEIYYPLTVAQWPPLADTSNAIPGFLRIGALRLSWALRSGLAVDRTHTLAKGPAGPTFGNTRRIDVVARRGQVNLAACSPWGSLHTLDSQKKPVWEGLDGTIASCYY